MRILGFHLESYQDGKKRLTVVQDHQIIADAICTMPREESMVVENTTCKVHFPVMFEWLRIVSDETRKQISPLIQMNTFNNIKWDPTQCPDVSPNPNTQWVKDRSIGTAGPMWVENYQIISNEFKDYHDGIAKQLLPSITS